MFSSDPLRPPPLPLSPAANPLLQLVYIMFWGAAVLVTIAYVYRHGEEFVNHPQLKKSD
jgi:hypothetical protein